jgi:hypothetical protein
VREAPFPHVSSRRAAIRRCGAPHCNGGMCEVRVKTQGEIEAAVCEGIARFEQEYMGGGPRIFMRI